MAALPLTPPQPLVLDQLTNNQNNEWINYKANLELYFTAANITEDKQKAALLLYLGGSELKKIYDTLDPAQKSTYKEAVALLDEHFKEKINLTYERYQFRSLTQNPNENCRSFITRLRSAVSKCEFKKYSDEQAVIDTFIEKVSDNKLRRKLLRDSELNITKLLEITTDAETAEMQASNIEKQTHHEEIETLNKLQFQNGVRKKTFNNPPFKREFYKNNRSDNLLCYGCGQNGHIHGSKECPALGQQCNFCHAYNHFETSCKKKKQNGNTNHNQPTGKKPGKFNKRNFNNALTIESDSDDEYLFCLNKMNDIIIKVDGISVPFLRDSGATINIIDKNNYDRIKQQTNIKLLPTSTKIYPYNSIKPLELKGVFYSNTAYKENHHIAKIYVSANSDAGCILGRTSSTELGVLTLAEEINNIETKNVQIDQIIQEYNELFSGLGCLKNVEVKFDIDETIRPVAQHLRRIPYHVRLKVEKKIKQLIDLDIIEPVTGSTPWISPVIAIPKGEDIRLVVDMRKPNTAIKRSHHPIPTLEELITKFNGCKLFSKIDLNNGYHQIQLHKDSRYITSFVTHEGVFQYKRLVQGVNDAFTIYQYHISQLFKQENLIENICDDILIAGRNEDEHNENVRKCFQILKENNLTVNSKKCIFGVKEIEFYGHVITEKGIKPAVKITEAVKNFTEPKNVKEVQSFLGLINYLGIFINNLSTLTAPLRHLIKKENKWKWGEMEKQAFEKLKNIATSKLCVAHFNPVLETILITDAGKIGLGAILAQKQEDGNIKPISYASRSLSKQEIKYSQTEKEALAIVWACERYHLYLYGKKFTILTDHQPLKILYSDKGKPSPRILRWGLRLQSYLYEIQYIQGKLNPADILSIKPLQTCHEIENETEKYINSLITYSIPKSVSLSEIIEESKKDEKIQKVINCLKDNNWEEEIDTLNEFYKIKSELTYKEGILLRGNQIIIPKSLQKKILSLAHEHHLGITRTKALLREKVWWPRINKQIEEVVLNCIACTAVSRPIIEPMKHNSIPLEKPWSKVHIDLCGPFPNGTYALGIIDSCSRFPDIYLTRNITSVSIIKYLKQCFSTHGYPSTIVTDNASNFTSIDISEFCEMYSINHHKATPYWPQANSEIERFYETLSKFVKTLTAEGRNWEHEIFDFLLTYRNTPHSTTNVSPAQLLMNKQLRDKIPFIDNKKSKMFNEVVKRDQMKKEKHKEYYDNRNHVKENNIQVGDNVLMKNRKKGKLETRFEIQPCKVIKVKGTSITVAKNGKEYVRNSSEFKKLRNANNEQNIHEDDEDESYSNDTEILQRNEQSTNEENQIEEDEEENDSILSEETLNADQARKHKNEKKYPVRNQKIKFKRSDTNTWEEGTVMYGQPKKKGMYSNWINIAKEEGGEVCINWDYVENWSEID